MDIGRCFDYTSVDREFSSLMYAIFHPSVNGLNNAEQQKELVSWLIEDDSLEVSGLIGQTVHRTEVRKKNSADQDSLVISCICKNDSSYIKRENTMILPNHGNRSFGIQYVIWYISKQL